MAIFRKGDMVNIREWTLFRKKEATKATLAKLGEFGVYPAGC